MAYFAELASHDNPGPADLQEFMRIARQFLSDLLSNELRLDHPRPDALPPLYAELRAEARLVYGEYVHERFDELLAALARLDRETLQEAGLIGRPMRLKLRTLSGLESAPGDASAYWPKVGRVFRQTDVILNSILDLLKLVAPGLDRFIELLKEFKSTLLNLVES